MVKKERGYKYLAKTWTCLSKKPRWMNDVFKDRLIYIAWLSNELTANKLKQKKQDMMLP